MEAVVMLLVLIAVTVLGASAALFGTDSRDSQQSWPQR
jgi:hypothetical protein